MSAEALDVSVGARLWCEGSTWTVVELDGTAAVSRSDDRIKRFHTPSLVLPHAHSAGRGRRIGHHQITGKPASGGDSLAPGRHR